MKMNKSFKLATGAVLATSFAAGSVVANANEKVEFKLGGQVSRAITFADNGTDDDILFVDNNNSGTRLFIKGKVAIAPGLSAGVHWETQYQDNSSGKLDINDADNSSAFISRKRDLWFKGGFGKLSLGQGDGAANGTSEIDNSGTWIANNSGDFLHSGLSFEDGTKMGKAFSNFDGLSRNDRLRYDAPNFGPVGVAISAGQDRAELGFRYNQKLGGGSKMTAALGYVGDNSKNFKQLGLSGSYLTAGGFSVTGQYGERDKDNTNVDPSGYYVKIGQRLGAHKLSVGYHSVDDLAAGGDEAERVNLSWVYNIHKGVELFADYQNASLSHSNATDPSDLDAFSLGSRVKF